MTWGIPMFLETSRNGYGSKPSYPFVHSRIDGKWIFMSLNLVQWVLIHPHVSQKNGTLSIILLESVLCKTGSVPILRFSRTFLPPGVRSLSPKIPNSHSLQGWPSIFESRAWQYGSTWGIQPIQQAPLGDPPTSPTIDVHIVLLCLISV